jgi:hypothetical protein
MVDGPDSREGKVWLYDVVSYKARTGTIVFLEKGTGTIVDTKISKRISCS